MQKKERCAWANVKNPLYIRYHDREWGRPLKSERKLFELLCLEGAQAGLSWETILNKRAAYRLLFHNFDPKKVASMKDSELERILKDPRIIRNRLKVYGFRKNAKAYLELKKDFKGLGPFLWSHIDKIKISNKKKVKDLPTETNLSREISKKLKKRGFTFVGPTIIYAFMQASGMVNDHTKNCFLHPSNQ